MPRLVSPALAPGSPGGRPQPTLVVDDELHLRPWSEADAAAVVDAFSCPDIQRWHLRRFDDHDEALAWIRGWADSWRSGSDGSWAVVAAGGVVGQVGLRTIVPSQASAALSYWVVPSARGREVAVRAARALTSWCFDDVGFHRLWLGHSTDNRASCRVATALGYAAEGTSRGALLHLDGWHDMHVHARLNASDDHPARRVPSR